MKVLWTLLAGVVLLNNTPIDAAEPKRPVPKGNPGDWVTPADYPPLPLREDIGGVVVFVLGVASDGSVTDCTVRQSSGNAELDSTACELLQARARFEPAIDKDGNATTGTWTSAVRWEVPRSTPIPPETSVRYRFVVEKDGNVSGCKVIEAPTEAPADAICNGTSRRSFEPGLGDDGLPVRTEVVISIRNEHRRLLDVVE